MFKVKRTKGGVTLWATEVAPAGNVTAWSKPEISAVPVSPAMAELVKAFHANRANVGTVECVAMTDADHAAIKAANNEREASAEEAKLRHRVAELEAEVVALKAKIPPPATDHAPSKPVAVAASAKSQVKPEEKTHGR